MNRALSAAVASATVVAAVACATILAAQDKKQVVALTPDDVRWFTPPSYNDGRQRAQLFGDSSQGGAWIDRVKIPGDAAKLRGYPRGSFIVIPAGVAHFVAAEKGAVVVQVSGAGKFQTAYVEK